MISIMEDEHPLDNFGKLTESYPDDAPMYNFRKIRENTKRSY